MRSSAIALLPLRCMTTRAIPPSRRMSTSSSIDLRGEERDAACDLDHGAGDVARLLGAQERDRAGDVFRLAELLEDCARAKAVVHRVVGSRRLAGFRLDD